ncbi:hypothetical protein SSBR45G_49240 [Bradyrhizobium sp. SSBR45G]|nr:hypothetical protein SSBR45G_49240 [Bradyrhizobium sp. SSBR45G]GLH87391.1 hypothetical protein SSBR45R_48510 [Bradyrhizobium sp. SSBR45R]
MSAACPQVFTLQFGSQPAFVFAADDPDTAQSIVRSPGLLRAIDAFCGLRHPERGDRLALRPATAHEAALYHDRTTEFADEVTSRLLIVHVRAD